MRIPVYKKTLSSFLCLLLLLLIGNMIVSTPVDAQDEPTLIIEVYDSNDWNESTGNIVFEGHSYDISVGTEEEIVVFGVNITVLEKTYTTNLTRPFITIEIPSFETTDSFTITARKEGYQNGLIDMTVLKGELFIQTNRTIVNENTRFSVMVTDQDNTPIEGAFVYVTEDASPLLTDPEGRAIAQAPEIEVLTTATIEVIKSGYLPGSTTIRIENVEGSIFNFSESKFLQILPVLLAILVVIIAVIYVLIKKRRETPTPIVHTRTKIAEEPVTRPNEKHPRSKQEPARYPEKDRRTISTSTAESRVEEIRIPVQVKKKETTILPEEQGHIHDAEEETKHPDDWFKGQDYMRYKIDELTGKIDQKTDGKWFEGEQDTKHKVDEALKKNLKKKKND